MLGRLCGVVVFWSICFVLALLYFWWGKDVPASPELAALTVGAATRATLFVLGAIATIVGFTWSICTIVSGDFPEWMELIWKGGR